MNKLKYIFVAIGVLFLCSFSAPKKDKSDRAQRIYMYGVAIGFNDSTVYMTDFLHVDNVSVLGDGSIANLASYSFQLESYLESVLGERDRTCAVFYSDKKKKLEKKFLKMRKEYQDDKQILFKVVGGDAFRFYKQ